MVATFLEEALAEVLDTFGSGDSSLSCLLVFFDLDYEFSYQAAKQATTAKILTGLTLVLISSTTVSSESSSSSSIADNGAL
jgi:hypothetical protein